MEQDRWTGVGLDRQVQAASSNPVILDGQALALWRGEDGPVRVWEDRCPHRGMRLSFGFVRGDTLRCIYHGWAYRTDGQCVEIPAHPDLAPPKTICANSYPAESRYGIVWTNLSGAGSAALPDFGADEGWEPVRSIYVDRPASVVREALHSFDFGDVSEVRMNGGSAALVRVRSGLEILFAVQPVSDGKTALHAVAKGQGVAGRRADLARRLERLRATIERA
nr:Rieske (2Fe-2S) protein [Pseudaminobacter soli]